MFAGSLAREVRSACNGATSPGRPPVDDGSAWKSLEASAVGAPARSALVGDRSPSAQRHRARAYPADLQKTVGFAGRTNQSTPQALPDAPPLSYTSTNVPGESTVRKRKENALPAIPQPSLKE